MTTITAEVQIYKGNGRYDVHIYADKTLIGIITDATIEYLVTTGDYIIKSKTTWLKTTGLRR